jgi:hypothetical protein
VKEAIRGYPGNAFMTVASSFYKRGGSTSRRHGGSGTSSKIPSLSSFKAELKRLDRVGKLRKAPNKSKRSGGRSSDERKKKSHSSSSSAQHHRHHSSSSRRRHH